MAWNPCCCWNLKDGCVTVGIWSLVWSIIQMGIFSWQTAVIKWTRERMENRRLPQYNSYSIYNNRLGGGDWNEIYITPEEKVYMALFIVQIVNLIAAFFLLFASVALIYGIHTSSKILVWPWFPCIVASIVCSITYCVLWWVGNVVSYWLALTVLEFIAVLINVYCLICVFLQYQRIVKGYVQHNSDDDLKKQKQVVYEYRTDDEDQQHQVEVYQHKEHQHQQDHEYYLQKQGAEGYVNATYEHEQQQQQLYQQELLRQQELQQQQMLLQQQQQMQATRVNVFGRAGRFAEVEKDSFHQAMNLHPIAQSEIAFGGQDPQNLTTGATIGDQETEIKDIFTEEWLKNIMMNGPSAENGKLPTDTQHVPYIKHRGRSSSRRSKSVDEKRDKDKDKHKHHKSSKSKDSVRSKKSHRSGKTDEGRGSSSSGDGDDGKTKTEKSHRSRSESHGRHKHHHRSRHEDSDSEATKSKSGIGGESDRGSRRHKDKKDKIKSKDDESKRKSLRNVKREDKERAASKVSQEAVTTGQHQQRPTSSSTDRATPASKPSTGYSSFPSYPVPPGGISIPQHIVIPPQPNRTQPQKYQINSEITISYSDKSAPPSDTEGGRRAMPVPVQTPQIRPLQPASSTGQVSAPSPSMMGNAAAVGTQTSIRTNSSGGESKSSKTHGASAV